MKHVIRLREAPEYISQELPFRTPDQHLVGFHDTSGTYAVYSYNTCIAQKRSGVWKVVDYARRYYRPHVELLKEVTK